jgi:hypothetical protein
LAAEIVPVMDPDVAAGQAGWFPPPHRKIITPPATFVGAKCKWDITRFEDNPENVSVKVIVVPISIWNFAVPAVLFGGTSLSPRSLAEKTSVSAQAGPATSPAASASLAKVAIVVLFIVRSSGRRSRLSGSILQLPKVHVDVDL